jgi:hypothetical protein
MREERYDGKKRKRSEQKWSEEGPFLVADELWADCLDLPHRPYVELGQTVAYGEHARSSLCELTSKPTPVPHPIRMRISDRCWQRSRAGRLSLFPRNNDSVPYGTR